MEQMLRVSIVGDTSKLNKALSQSSARLKNFGAKLTGIGANLSARVTLPLALAGGAAIKFASDLEESLNKVDVAFKGSSQEVRDFAKTTLTSFGIAEGTALDMAAMFGDMSTSMGLTTSEASSMSTQLVALAGDLASFKNINIDEVTTALSGVFTGETESLKRLGIVMTEVNLKQFALNKGIKTQLKDMTQAEKVALRFQYVMSVTANSQGDFARTSGGAANQTRVFTEGLKQLAANFGELLLPLFTKIVTKLNGLVTDFGNLDKETKRIIITFGLVAAALPPLVMALGGLATAIGIITSPISLLVAGAVALGVALYEAQPYIDNLTESIGVYLQNAFLDMEARFKIFSNGLSRLKRLFVEFVKNRFDGDFESINNEFKQLNQSILENVSKQKESNKESSKARIEGTKYVSVLGKLKSFAISASEALTSFGSSSSSVNTTIKNLSASTDSLTYKFTNYAKKHNDVNEQIKNSTLRFNEVEENRKRKIEESANAVINLGGSISGVLIQSFEQLQAGGNFFKPVIQALKGLIARLIAAAAAAAVLNALLPTKAANAGGFGGIFSAISGLKNFGIESFANGGIVSAPTLAMVGDNFGASRGNPEVISPLNKLQSMIGGRDVNVSGQFRLEGQDLVVALQRANRNRSRLI